MRVPMLIANIITGVIWLAVGTQISACGDFPFKRLMEGAPQTRYKYRARYENGAYQYSVVIPKGFTGYDGRDQASHEGFGIVLGKPPAGYILARGEHNSAEYGTPREAALREIYYLRQGGKMVESETISSSHLGRLGAVELQVAYTCPGSAQRQLLSSIIALSPDKRFLYTIELYTTPDRYSTDRIPLDRIRESWRIFRSSEDTRPKYRRSGHTSGLISGRFGIDP